MYERVPINLSCACLGNLLAHNCKHVSACTSVVVVLVLVEEVRVVDGSRLQGLAPPDVPSRLCQNFAERELDTTHQLLHNARAV